ncbi:hypothetical protein RFI_30677 [Reticulomyxa filosa]|uniref:Uncharacterized protein n=1 Tax=Reticulomyxa filosa TaxID=46433 RepID=X6LZC8_RETFI|nr:hypothetical protein RFI_30677 [Reticulomyxa filosa]|eukprot:ETO06716.1 hypothetical protein RFI_30677 [Reticulomyxa filosa]
MLHVLSVLAFLLVSCSARLAHFALVYQGECVQASTTERECQGSARSQTIAAYIDPTEGVQFQDTQQDTGVTSLLTITIIQNPKSFQAYGYINFGFDPNTQIQTTLTFENNQNDLTAITNGDHFIDAGFYNITGLICFDKNNKGGTGAYSYAHGLISLNGQGQYNTQNQVSDWYAFLEAAIGIPE